jgi:serine/threonine-protein kinase
MIKGKVAYMAPEQAMAADVDRRVDIFAAGAVLLELVTGQRLWGKHIDEIQIMTRLIAGDLPNDPKVLKPDIDDELAAIIRRALAPKADDRYATAADFQAALENYARKIGALSRTRELGAWVAELYADRREQKRAIIEKRLQQMKEMDAGALVRANPTLPPSLSAQSGPYPSVTPTSSHTQTKQSQTVDAKRKRLAGFVAAGVGVCIAGFVALYALGQRHEGAVVDGAPNGSASAGSLGGNAPGGEKMHLGVRTTPPDARLTLDDTPVANPYTGDVPKDGAVHHLAADAPGYKHATRDVTFGQSVDMSIDLERDAATTRHHAGGGTGGGGGGGGARNTGGGGGSNDQGHFGDRDTPKDVSKKAPRPIDSADPW